MAILMNLRKHSKSFAGGGGGCRGEPPPRYCPSSLDLCHRLVQLARSSRWRAGPNRSELTEGPECKKESGSEQRWLSACVDSCCVWIRTSDR